MLGYHSRRGVEGTTRWALNNEYDTPGAPSAGACRFAPCPGRRSVRFTPPNNCPVSS